MNILFVSSFPIEPIAGGVQRVTSILADEFQKLGFLVHCLVLKKAVEELEFTIKHHFLPENDLSTQLNKNFYSNLLNEYQFDVIINQAGVYKEVIDFVADREGNSSKLFTVHHNCIQCLRDNYKNILLGSSYGKLLKVFGNKIVWDILLFNNKWKYANNFRNAINKSDKLVVLAESYKDELKTYLNSWPNEKIESISNPLSFDIQHIDLSMKENRLVYVGRVEYAQKQVHLLIPIWKEISRQFPDWHLDVVGDGNYLEQIKKDSDEANLSNIHFYGHQDPKPFLRRSKIFLMTSSFEGFPMVIVEAQLFGVVPIAFNSFSCLEYIFDGNAGLIINPFDLNEYILTLSLLMQDDRKRELFVEKGYKAASRFMPSKIAQDWVELMQN